MNKLFVGLTTIVIALSIVSGLLFYQVNAVRGLNSELRSQNVEVQNQLDELQDQWGELKVRNDEVENQIIGLQNQNSELQTQISEQLDRNGELHNQTVDLQVQVNEVQDQLNMSQNQVSYLQSQIGEQLDDLSDITYELARERPLHALITKFKWMGFFSPLGGLAVNYAFNVTVQNTDVIGLGGLTLTVRTLKKGTLVQVENSRAFSMQIDHLRAGESREISGMILATFGTLTPDSAVCAIKLTVRGIVLDERTYNLS